MVILMSYKSRTQIKRESYDYRSRYLEHNHGLFGGIYLCSQCFRIMSREEMQVDHIVPIAKWFAPNRVFNCVSICPTCNKKKSDKISKSLIFKGLLMKMFEEFYILIQRIIILLLRLLLVLLIMIVRILVRPLVSDRSIVQKGVVVGFYLVSLKLIFVLL